MTKFKHLNKSKLEYVTQRFLVIESSLDGLEALFHGQDSHSCPDINELYGMGDLIKELGREVSILTGILEYGYDSKAITKDWSERD